MSDTNNQRIDGSHATRTDRNRHPAGDGKGRTGNDEIPTDDSGMAGATNATAAPKSRGD